MSFVVLEMSISLFLSFSRKAFTFASALFTSVCLAVFNCSTSSFAFVAGLAWNNAIQALIEQFVGKGNALTSLFSYAIIVTIIAVIVTVLLARFAAKMGIELDN